MWRYARSVLTGLTVLAVLAALSLGLAPLARAAAPGPYPKHYPAAGPNDPNYAPLERDTSPTACATGNVNDEEHYLYSFEPKCAPNATDPLGAAGMSVDKAWADYSTGDPRVVMAYVEGGINWFDPGVKDLVDNVYVNWKELPIPCRGGTLTTAVMTLNGHTTSCRPAWSADPVAYEDLTDGVVNVEDYAQDPRVHDANHDGFLDPEDLIVAFSCYDRFTETIGVPSWPGGVLHCSNGAQQVDNDGDGFPHDISGWDFYDHQNDPATYDSTYDHSDNQMLQADAEGNNGLGGVGLCPDCMIMPIKAGAEALDRTDDLAQAWLYACHAGAKVVISVTADVGYSSYMNQAVDYCWAHGVVMVEASNDFDSLDHQGGMFHPYVLPGNGEVPNTYGYDTVDPGGVSDAAINQATTTFSTRSDETSWGTHAVFSASTQGGSTSESTPTVGGAFGLLLSWGMQAADEHLISGPLTADEAIQVMRATATPITNPNLPWPGSPGDWNAQYGYGRPDLYAALRAVARDDIPPEAYFTTPTWYSLYDPTRVRWVPITATVAAPRSAHYTWQLQYGLGGQPSSWNTISSGAGTKPFTGTLGSLDLAKIPRSFATAPMAMSATKELETNDQYTVTLRLRVTDAAGRLAEDRRAIAVEHDPSELPGFPLPLNAEGGHGNPAPGTNIDGMSQPATADLQGRGDLALIYGDSDGYVNAVDPKTGRELPGWPVHTERTVPAYAYPGIDPGYEPVIAPVAVGDLFHTGQLDVVVTSTTGRTYAFNAFGHLLPGWPKTLDTGAVSPPIPRPALDYTRLAHQGALAPPVLFPLAGGHQLDILQSAWDGHVYAWTPSGANLPGWPVKVSPAALKPPSGEVMINDEKIDLPPAIAYLSGNASPDIVVQSQYDFTPGSGVQEGGAGNVFAFHADGTPVAGWPVTLPAVVVYYGSAQEFLTEGSTAPVVAPATTGGDDVAVSPGIFSPTYLLNGSGRITAVFGPEPNPAAEILAGAFAPTQLAAGNLPADAPVTFTTSGAFGEVGGVGTLDYAQPGSGAASVAAALLLNGSGTPIKNYIRLNDVSTSASAPGFPQQMQGLDFLGEPLIAPVTATGGSSVIEGADSSLLDAFTPTGPATGFPKFTTGWVIFAPTAADLLSTGSTDIVASTREGYLMAWATPGPAAANTQWWTEQHDEWRTGRYGVDSRPPGTLREVHYRPGDATASFVAPGDNWYSGEVAGYRLDVDGKVSTFAPAGPAGTVQTVSLPRTARRVIVQAYDAAGNLGPAIDLASADGRPAAGAGIVFPGGPLRGAVVPETLAATGPTGQAAWPLAASLLLLGAAVLRRRSRSGRHGAPA